MSALFKTLFGDLRNLLVVALAVGAELAMVFGGFEREAAFAMPIIVLGGIAWLATQ